MRIDPRYRWQEVDGVIVIRPVRAWFDSEDPLPGLAPSVRLQDVPAAKPIQVVVAALGGAQATGFPDTRLLSIDLPRGPVLDLLNEISRQHGELSWTWRELPPDQQTNHPQRSRNQIWFYLPGGNGMGFGVP